MPPTRSKSQKMKAAPNHIRTWIEIDARAAKKNYDTFRKLIGKKVRLWSVVKSNAYGHGLIMFSKLADRLGIDGFCVDSIVEGLALRKAGIKKPILVLGQTLPARYADAARHDIKITVSNFDALRGLARVKRAPSFHIKMDTGFHRQGFYPEEVRRIIGFLRTHRALGKKLEGIYTHFASAKDVNYPMYTDLQTKRFEDAAEQFRRAGFKNIIRHAAATGGTLIGPKYHFDAVRVGIGLYGLWPSKELETQLGDRIRLYPVLSWRTVISEVKKIQKGDYIGYDLTERMTHGGTMAVLPIGYWHGFDRSLSSIGEVLVRGRRARVLGRVSMDMVVIEPGRGAKPYDRVTLIGRDGRDEIFAWELAQRSGTTHYEIVTRLNPLMERILT